MRGALVPRTVSLRKEMERLFDRFFEPIWPEPMLGEWEPTLDVAETKDEVVVKVEVPGVEPKDIAVALEDGMLTIKGEKRAETEEKDKRYHRVERSYGAFYRAIRVPAPVDETKVKATFKDGVVTITMPKAPGAKGKTIPIEKAA